MTSEELKAEIELDKKTRQEAFKKELEDLKLKYNCEVNPMIILRPEGITPFIEINAK